MVRSILVITHDAQAGARACEVLHAGAAIEHLAACTFAELEAHGRRELDPDLIAAEENWPDGQHSLAHLRAIWPHVPVLALCDGSPASVVAAFSHGARGCLCPDTPAREIRGVLSAHAAGVSPVLPRHLSARYARWFRDALGEARGRVGLCLPQSLTVRECEVLGLLLCGLSHKEVATCLYVAEETVKTHTAHVLHKLRLPDRARLLLALAVLLRVGGAGPGVAWEIPRAGERQAGRRAVESSVM